MDPYRVLQLREGAPRDLVEEVYWALIGRAKHEHPAERDFALRIRELNAAYDAVVRSMDEARDRAPGPKRAAPPQRRFWRRAAAPTTPDDLYGLLHVDEQADHDVIALAARFALNQLRTRPDQQARLLAVQAARDVLLDLRLRAEYDAAAASRLAAGPPAEATAAAPTTPAATASPSAGTLAGPTSPAAPRPAAAPANASTVNAGPATPTPAYADAAQHAPPSGDAAVHASASTPPTPAESAATQADAAAETPSELPVNAQPAEDAGIGPTADAGGAGAIELDAPAERAVPADGDGALMRGTPKPDPRDAARDNGSAHRRANQRGWQIWRRASPDDPDPDAIDQRLLSLRLQPERVVREEPRVMAGEDVPPPRVRVVSGPGTGTCIAVAAGEGADDAVVVPGDEGPSFRIWQRADNYVLERLRDDVRVAGARSDLPVVLLDDGDEITAGATVFRFEISPGVAQSGKRIARSI